MYTPSAGQDISRLLQKSKIHCRVHKKLATEPYPNPFESIPNILIFLP
jgi:hypothetical protein